MATKLETKIVCDVCKETTTDDGQTYYGGHPFNGWFHIDRHGGATDLASLRKQKDWDICSLKCLKKLAATIED
jgi:hypothetical protein